MCGSNRKGRKEWANNSERGRLFGNLFGEIHTLDALTSYFSKVFQRWASPKCSRRDRREIMKIRKQCRADT